MPGIAERGSDSLSCPVFGRDFDFERDFDFDEDADADTDFEEEREEEERESEPLSCPAFGRGSATGTDCGVARAVRTGAGGRG